MFFAQLALPFKVQSLPPHNAPDTPCQHPRPLIGDDRVLHAARKEARNQFDTKRTLLPTDQEVNAAIVHAEDVAKILRQNVVQGEKTVDESQEERYRESICDLSLKMAIWWEGMHEPLTKGSNRITNTRGNREGGQRHSQNGGKGNARNERRMLWWWKCAIALGLAFRF